jgi:BioD-like phosphotransacetylase family protein
VPNFGKDLKKQNGAQYLLIGSTDAYSGKSSTILGISQQLQAKGLDIAYTKPIGKCEHDCQIEPFDEDVKFLSSTLNLTEKENKLGNSILFLEEALFKQRLQAKESSVNYVDGLQKSLEQISGDIVLVEGPGTLDEGYLYHLSLPEIAEVVDASVLLVSRFDSPEAVEMLLSAKHRLGDRLIGVVLNHIPPEKMAETTELVKPFLEQENIPVFAILPRIAFLGGVSVGDLAARLNAQVLCRKDRLDLMVESLKIGAMNVNSALKYLSTGQNMAVVTGGGRTDIQLAALETSTHCLIVTGNLSPSPIILNRAEEAEVPVLSVDLDTLTTVEIISDSLGQVRLHEPMKSDYIRQLFNEHFRIDRLLDALSINRES